MSTELSKLEWSTEFITATDVMIQTLSDIKVTVYMTNRVIVVEQGGKPTNSFAFKKNYNLTTYGAFIKELQLVLEERLAEEKLTEL